LRDRLIIVQKLSLWVVVVVNSEEDEEDNEEDIRLGGVFGVGADELLVVGGCMHCLLVGGVSGS